MTCSESAAELLRTQSPQGKPVAGAGAVASAVADRHGRTEETLITLAKVVAIDQQIMTLIVDALTAVVPSAGVAEYGVVT